ncbi:Creatinase aminopeptidase [Armillaria novae-zelandiae]|uniref:Creatinase aminopeptidase n=1 Tax=Armillaria novae-zelandiae TaxID=153914 RepID=A0AA39UB16_9AGAR|nr:Creatinase aminopeptidase [Armillaria novae-zelandiae]
MPPPPPPPPVCFPFGSKKEKRRLSFSSMSVPPLGGSASQLERAQSQHSKVSFSSGSGSRSSTASRSTSSSMTASVDNLTFVTDSEKYDEVPKELPPLEKSGKNGRLQRSNTMTGTKKSTLSNRWGYGWGLGKQREKEKEAELTREMSQSQRSKTPSVDLPVYQPPVRHNSQSTQASRTTQNTQSTHRSKSTHRSNRSGHSQALRPNESSSTLVGSSLERKNTFADSLRDVVHTSERLAELRKQMEKEQLDFYIVPNEDAHGSEYVAESDKRREYISGFSGSAGQAIVSKTEAYLITDSRYWLQATEQLDANWKLVRAGAQGEPKDWIDWLVAHAQSSRVGIDGRMLPYEQAILINSKINPMGGKLVYPVQNLIDLIWKGKPTRSKEPVFLQPIQYSGEEAHSKIAEVQTWVKNQPPDIPSYSRSEPKPSQYQVGTLITALPQIAYLLNLRGSDIPFNPLFHAYLFVGIDSVILFLEGSKVPENIASYLEKLKVTRRDYSEIWAFLRKREWGEGKIIISPQSSYTISLVLSHYRCSVLPSHVEYMISVKNDTELKGLRRAYTRDGVAFVQFLAWLDEKLYAGYDITEWEAAQRLTEFRRKQEHFMGLAYQNISASGPNAALPHYSPRKSEARMIDKHTPYLNDSGGQYLDGTCDTTRTIHFGRPDAEQCEAFTRVLQGHIAIDTAVFPEGTSGRQLDVLARRALWKEGYNYLHGTGHGFGSFLTVHEGPQGFSSNVPLVPGHVVTNEPGFYNDGKWGIRIESALAVRRVTTRGEYNGPIWLSFERLTCVPIQTRMIKDNMLTKEEKAWIKDHNAECFKKLKPLLQNDKRALKWLDRESKREIGLAGPGPGGVTIEWD